MMEKGKNIIVTSEEVQDEIVGLLRERFGIFIELESGENYDFFGLHGLLGARDLTYLSYLLEIRYGVRFCMKEYDDPNFYHISGLAAMISNLVSEKNGVAP